MNLLELDGIRKVYHRGGWFGRGARIDALIDVTLAVPEGRSIGVIGRSGAGKSTLGRIILGLEKPDRGTVRYRGRDMKSFTREEWKMFRHEVQVVFQNSLGSVNPRWQVSDIVAEPLLNFEQISPSRLRKRVENLLEMVGLTHDDADKYPHQFSGGQLQRVCMARALALEPRLIILDEAVSSLDMLVQAQILKFLRELQRETGVSYLFVSHDIRIVTGFCDMVAVINHGRITSQVTSLLQAENSDDPILRQLAESVLPAWPKFGTNSCRN